MQGKIAFLPMLAEVGGTRWRLEHGDNPLPLPPGVWPLKVWCSYFGIKTGRAAFTVDTRAGQPLLLYYEGPRSIYNRGALTYEPPAPRGRGSEWVSLIVVVVLVALCFAYGLYSAHS